MEPVTDIRAVGTFAPGVTVSVDGTVLTSENGNLWRHEPGTWHFEFTLDDKLTFTVVGERGAESEEITVTVEYDPDLKRAFGGLVGIEDGGLVLDPATLLLGEEAEEYLGTEPVDGYHIVDDEPGVLETWPIADDAFVLMVEQLEVPPPLFREVRVPVEQLAAILAGEDEGSWWVAGDFPVPAFVYLEEGIVVQIRVRWAP